MHSFCLEPQNTETQADSVRAASLPVGNARARYSDALFKTTSHASLKSEGEVGTEKSEEAQRM